jgi:hypothetical protein
LTILVATPTDQLAALEQGAGVSGPGRERDDRTRQGDRADDVGVFVVADALGMAEASNVRLDVDGIYRDPLAG